MFEGGDGAGYVRAGGGQQRGRRLLQWQKQKNQGLARREPRPGGWVAARRGHRSHTATSALPLFYHVSKEGQWQPKQLIHTVGGYARSTSMEG
jgi:hypothetical protein